MFEIEKIFRFEAGHSLVHHDGKCKDPHGHSYQLIVHLTSPTLTAEGSKKNMVIDFSDISAVVKPMIDKYFDHKWMNESLGTDSPTVEYMAKWIFDYLIPHLPLLTAVTLYETATSKATYRKS